jgi:large subunit ribosomal protein L24e
MPTCSFCKKNYEFPRGLTLFTFDGKSVYFCSSKCRRNADLKRDPKKTNWVKSEKKIKEVKPVEVKKEKVEVKTEEKKEAKVEEKKSEVKTEEKKEEKVEEKK